MTLSQITCFQVKKTPTENTSIDDLVFYDSRICSYNVKLFFISNAVSQKISMLQDVLHQGSPVVLLQNMLKPLFSDTFRNCTLQLMDCCSSEGHADRVLTLNVTQRALGMSLVNFWGFWEAVGEVAISLAQKLNTCSY